MRWGAVVGAVITAATALATGAVIVVRLRWERRDRLKARGPGGSGASGAREERGSGSPRGA